jgi:hypothetical protein
MKIVVRAICSCFVLSAVTISQSPGSKPLSYAAETRVRNRIFDLVAPVAESRPFFSRLVLRFSDSAYQCVLTVYTQGKSELITYKLDRANFSQLTRELLMSEMSDQEIKRHVAVTTHRRELEMKQALGAIEELRQLKIPAYPQERIAVDDYSTFEYWLETPGELVHFRINGPFQGKTPRDRLVQWMIRFRDNFAID